MEYDCPICGAEMSVAIQPNGKVAYFCPVCKVDVETEYLAPSFFNNAEEYDTIKENGEDICHD